jgi:hypothetical protein
VGQFEDALPQGLKPRIIFGQVMYGLKGMRKSQEKGESVKKGMSRG